MVKAGYSKTTASTTGKLTNTKGWNALLQKHIPDSKLAKVLDEGLEASDVVVDKDGLTIAENPDFAVRHKYLETALKLKAKFPKEGQGEDASDGLKILMVQINNVINEVKKDA